MKLRPGTPSPRMKCFLNLEIQSFRSREMTPVPQSQLSLCRDDCSARPNFGLIYDNNMDYVLNLFFGVLLYKTRQSFPLDSVCICVDWRNTRRLFVSFASPNLVP